MNEKQKEKLKNTSNQLNENQKKLAKIGHRMHELSTQREQNVVKSNDLVLNSRHDFTLQQQKILAYIVSKVAPFDIEFREFTFSIAEFCAVVGINDSGRNYQEIKADLKALRDTSRYITINGEETTISWLEKVKINKKTGIVKIRLDEDLKSYLLQLRQNYSTYQLIWVLNFQSKYSFILYELFNSIHYDINKPYQWIMTVDNLKAYLNVVNLYPKWGNLKQRIISTALKEINELTDKEVEYEEIKKGQKVVAVRFTIKQKDSEVIEELKERMDKDLNADQYNLFDALGI